MTWSDEKLSALKAQYTGDNEDAIHNPEYARIASHIMGEGGYRPAPFAGFPTLLDAPAREFNADTLAQLQVALIGMPMDLAVTNRNGSRFGPRALRAIERIGPYNDGLGVAPIHEMRVADTGDVPFRSRFHLDKSHEDIEAHLHKVCDAGVLPLSVGGDHSISHPILRAVGRDRPVGMIHIDAHCDTGSRFDGERFHHGGPFRNAVLDGVLDPERTVQIGIRGAAGYLWEFSNAAGMTVISAQEIDRIGLNAVLRTALEVVGEGPTYISFDIDSIDPAFAPGTGTPEVGGLTPREVLTLLRGLKGVNLVGGDVVEVAPAYDSTTNTPQVAAQVLFELLSLARFSPSLKT